MSRTKREGDRGEAAVAAYLEARGCEILARQWRCRQGELDLVVRTPEGILCFVEVKLRSAGAIGLPREAVAALYLSTCETDAPARFDVAEVYAEDDGNLRVEYLEDAFT